MRSLFGSLVRSFVCGSALVAAVTVAASCGDDSGTTPVDDCKGGVIVDGKCEGKCSPELCLEGNTCVGNRCMLECTSHDQCYSPLRGDAKFQGCLPQTGDSETGLNDGATVYVCTDVDKAPAYGKLCAFGDECDADYACPDGTPCTAGQGSPDHCSAAECRPMTCRTTGEGDADAYCTTFDCTADADCAPGFYCEIVNLAQNICGTMKGDQMPCIDPADFTKDKATYQEGPFTALRNQCVKRRPCAPCEFKADCSLGGEMECVTIGDTKHCAKTCATDDDCPNDFSCYSNFCVPRSGTCTPPTTGDTFCYNCLNDLDCGPADGTSVCLGGDVELFITPSAGMRACMDLSLPYTCTTDADCPTSPSGKHGECLDEGEGANSSSPYYHLCYIPFYPQTSSFACWGD